MENFVITALCINSIFILLFILSIFKPRHSLILVLGQVAYISGSGFLLGHYDFETASSMTLTEISAGTALVAILLAIVSAVRVLNAERNPHITAQQAEIKAFNIHLLQQNKLGYISDEDYDTYINYPDSKKLFLSRNSCDSNAKFKSTFEARTEKYKRYTDKEKLDFKTMFWGLLFFANVACIIIKYTNNIDSIFVYLNFILGAVSIFIGNVAMKKEHIVCPKCGYFADDFEKNLVREVTHTTTEYEVKGEYDEYNNKVYLSTEEKNK